MYLKGMSEKQFNELVVQVHVEKLRRWNAAPRKPWNFSPWFLETVNNKLKEELLKELRKL